MVLLFAPSHDDALLGVAFGAAAFLMLAVEEARARTLLSLDAFYGRFLDQRDSTIALTHIYLLMGCALPHWINLILKHDGADCLVLKLGGVAVLGAATPSPVWIGRRFGKETVAQAPRRLMLDRPPSWEALLPSSSSTAHLPVAGVNSSWIR